METHSKKVFKTIAIIVIVILLIPVRNYLAYRDVEGLKQQAPEFIDDREFIITSYDGYSGDLIHGGFVWFQVRDANGYLYKLAVGEWKGELMIYNQTCLNAVTNDK